MPYIVVRMLEGRTVDQKRELARDITEVAARDLKVSPDKIVIEIEEFTPENMALGAPAH